jgi:ferredoxin
MSARVEPRLLQELKAYGAANIEACFNCGNCTAVCPLSTGDSTFPRRLIRLAQVGLRAELLESKELWMCYYCGECTSTCPRGAAPGEFMAAARRYAIASYDGLGLGKLLLRWPAWSVAFLVALAGLLAGLMLTQRGVMQVGSLALFDFIPYPLIHSIGLAAMAVVAVTGLWGMVNMIRQVVRGSGLHKGVRYDWWSALWSTLFVEVLAQKRYRDGCETGPDSPPWYRQKWFIHATIMWGFLGLLAATVLDYATDLLGIKPTGMQVPIWSPIRLLGTLAGLLLVYGTTVLIVRRLSKADQATEHSTASDWSFLVMMWLSGMTGFVLTGCFWHTLQWRWR